MTRNANSTAATTATLDIDWGDPAADAAEFSPRAERVVERLIALGADEAEIEVYHGDTLPESLRPSTRPVADGWFYMGRKVWQKRDGTKVRHNLLVRTCYVVAYIADTAVAVHLSEMRYGGGKVRHQPVEVGSPVYSPTFEVVAFEGREAVAARAALGMDR